MSSYKDKSDFYANLATLLAAGVSVPDALAQPYHGAFRRLASRLARRIAAGSQLWEAFSCERGCSNFECSLIKIGELTGTLPGIFRSLSEWFGTRHALRGRMVLSLLYPLFVYHFAGLVFALVSYVSKTDASEAIIAKLILWFLFPWLAFLLCRVISRLLPGAVLNAVPFFGDLIFRQETAFYFKVLGISLEAGLGAIDALSLAADCCRSSFYKRRYRRVAEIVRANGCSISQAFNAVISFRERRSPIPTLLASAEASGTLPDACGRISAMQQDEATRKMAFLAKALPGLLYFAACAYIGYRIILVFKGYFDQIQSLL